MTPGTGGEPRESPPLQTERTFYGKVGIIGPTGSGKSYLTKTCDENITGYINMERKPLPYQDKVFNAMAMPKTWSAYKLALTDYGGLGAEPSKFKHLTQIVVDSQTMAFNTLMKEMAQNFSGFDVFKQYNRQVYEYLELLKSIEKDIIVFSHDEWLKVEGEGKKRMMAVHGKEFEGKIEQHFTTVLFTGSRMKDGKPSYFLKTYEQETSTKTPERQFPNPKDNNNNFLEFPNDGQYIFDCIKTYYTRKVNK